jgi:hypothetical protein
MPGRKLLILRPVLVLTSIRPIVPPSQARLQ